MTGKISSHTTGFVGANDKVAVCLLPGTELAFAAPVQFLEHVVIHGPGRKILTSRFDVARFVQVDLEKSSTFHDALTFPDGEIVLLQNLILHQKAKVLQLPAPQARVEIGGDDVIVEGIGVLSTVGIEDTGFAHVEGTGGIEALEIGGAIVYTEPSRTFALGYVHSALEIVRG
ncbi:MAG: hypothetical protein KBD50_02345 [Candidatus Pacebacteria bacterium]|nr:hypothetical protein [Candidatus Paceibacterota bacterium]